jgi:hypothetical protein
MIKEAIDRILSLAPIQVETIKGQWFVKEGQKIERLKMSDEQAPEALVFNTLTGLADYVALNPDALPIGDLVAHVVDFNRVDLIGPLQSDNDNNRFVFAQAKSDLYRTAFAFGKWFPSEDFIIQLGSKFCRSAEGENGGDDTDKIVEMVSKIASERLKTLTDSGFAQVVQVKTGLTMLSSVKVQNPVIVRPYRTFREINQPQTLALLRFAEPLKDNEKNTSDKPQLPSAALFESGGEAWKLEAIASIEDWLAEHCPELRVLA